VSIQSAVAYGHAGNSSAVFALQRTGVEVWPVHTVNFSNHTGYGSWRGKAIPAEEVWDIVLGIDERGALRMGGGDVGEHRVDRRPGAAVVHRASPACVCVASACASARISAAVRSGACIGMK